PPIVEGDAWVEFPLPSSVKLGLAWQATKTFRLQLQAEYFHYADVENFIVTLQSPGLAQPRLGVSDTVKLVEPRRLRDTMSAQATGIWRVNDWFEIGVTGGYQSSAVPDATMSLSSPDGDRLIGALAGRVV